MSRKPIIAGNWKMNKKVHEANELIRELIPLVEETTVECVFCPPYIDLIEAVHLTKDTPIEIGAQNMHWEDHGAFTGEIAGDMLKDIGVKFVIIGHSERRQYNNETDEDVNKKAKKALELDMTPIVCCGETLEQREQGKAQEVVVGQVKKDLANIDDVTKVVVAYEPIWAIGTGKVATTEQAEEVCAAIRQCIGEIYDGATAEAIRIQYGGSVSASSAPELFAQPDIDGGLVGGASLKADFGRIVNYNRNA